MPDPANLLGTWTLRFHFGGRTFSHHMVIQKFYLENADATDPISHVSMPFSFSASGWYEDDPRYRWQCRESSLSLCTPFPVDFWIRYTDLNPRYRIHAWGQISWGGSTFPTMSGKATAPYQHSNEDCPGYSGTFDAQKI